jgi:large subunit ribosomal protein L15
MKGAHKKNKRVGRGVGSGHGKTSGRGHKGLKARSGKKMKPGFEGGQMPLARRLPKRGFTNIFKTHYQIVNIEQLNKFKKDSIVDAKLFKQARLIKSVHLPIKVLSRGKINKALHIKVQAISHKAKEKVEQAKGKVELIKPC